MRTHIIRSAFLLITAFAIIGGCHSKNGNSIKLAVAADFAETAERLGDDPIEQEEVVLSTVQDRDSVFTPIASNTI